MKPLLTIRRRLWDEATGPQHRRGAMLVLAFFTLVASIGFVAFTIDIGVISNTKTRMQNAVDAAALAAVLEISNAIQNAGENVENVPAYAQTQAAAMAEQVMSLNGIYIDPNSDVEFGTRSYNPGTEEFEVTWGTANANVVRVTARKDNADANAPDAQLNLFFAGFFGDDQVTLTASAVAYIESRDIVSVLDFSRSMNFDSYFNTEANSLLSDADIADNLLMVWDDLQPLNVGNMGFTPQYVTLSAGSGSSSNPSAAVTFRYNRVDVSASSRHQQSQTLTFSNGSTQTFYPSGSSGTFQGTGSNSTRDITKSQVRFSIGNSYVTQYLEDSDSNVRQALGLVRSAIHILKEVGMSSSTTPSGLRYPRRRLSRDVRRHDLRQLSVMRALGSLGDGGTLRNSTLSVPQREGRSTSAV